MPNMTNTLIANITATEDTTQNVPINRSTGNPAFDSSASQMVEYLTVPVGVTVLALPKSPCTQLYLRNIDPSQSIAVSWTPNGQANVVVIELNPNDQIIIWCKPGGTVGPGITALSINSATNPCLIEYFLGG